MQQKYFRSSTKRVEAFISFAGHSNLIIACCAFMLSLQTALVFGLRNMFALALFNGLSAFFVYNAQRLYQFYSKQLLLDSRHQWLNYKARFMLFLLIPCAGLLLYIAWYRIYFLIPYYLMLLLIALFYFLPVISLRSVPFLKVAVIALVWVLSCCYLPDNSLTESDGLLHLHFKGLNPEKVKYSISQLCFVAALCIPFDIRDAELDKQKGTPTLPVVLGIKKSKQISFFLLILYLIIGFFIQSNTPLVPVYFSIALLTSVAVYYASSARSSAYFMWFCDGLIILEGVLVIIFNPIYSFEFLKFIPK